MARDNIANTIRKTTRGRLRFCAYRRTQRSICCAPSNSARFEFSRETFIAAPLFLKPIYRSDSNLVPSDGNTVCITNRSVCQSLADLEVGMDPLADGMRNLA